MITTLYSSLATSLTDEDYIGARLFPKLSGTQYGEIAVTQSVTSGDTLTIPFSTTTSGTSMFLCGDDATPASAEFDAGNLLQLVGCTATIDGTAVADGASIAAYQDGKLRDLVLTFTGSLTVGFIGQNGAGAGFWEGQLLSHQFTISSVVQDPVIYDSGSIYYQLQRGTSLGADITSITLGAWTDNLDGSYSLVGDGSFQPLTILSTTVGKWYEVKVDVDSLSGGTLKLQADGGASISSLTTGANTVVFKATTATVSIGRDAGTITVTISGITSKLLPDSTLILYNFSASDWSQYTLQRNIVHDAGTVALGWLSNNLVVNGAFDADTDWTKGTGWTISGGTASSDGSQVGASDLSQASIVDNSSVYLHGVTVTGVTAGGVKQLSGGALGASLTADGVHAEIITASSSGLGGAQADATFVGSVDNVTIRHLIEVV